VEKDPIVRRMRLQAGQRLSSQDQLFTITVDFSSQPQEGPVDVLLPGDEVLLGLFIAAKSLVHKGSLVIDNAPLDPWALPVLSLLRKMGSKPSQQETHQTAFGAAGMLSIQKFDLTGQKTECAPLYHYLHQLPAMVIITAFAEGQSIFRRLEDLRLSEPECIKQIEACLTIMNAKFGDMPDGFVIQGGRDYDGFDMIEPLPAGLSGAFAIAGLCCMGSTTINDEQLAQRWPMFQELLEKLFEYRT
jgi:3-phosphoshikimate 1-carboxyvinyltransferase